MAARAKFHLYRNSLLDATSSNPLFGYYGNVIAIGFGSGSSDTATIGGTSTMMAGNGDGSTTNSSP